MSAAAAWGHLAGSGLLGADPVPSPSPTGKVPDELTVTPGLAGFLATFAVAVACVLLFLSLTRHLRRAQHNAEEQGLPVDRRRTIGRRPAEPEATEPGEPDRPDDGPEDPWPGGDPEGPSSGEGPDGGGRR